MTLTAIPGSISGNLRAIDWTSEILPSVSRFPGRLSMDNLYAGGYTHSEPGLLMWSKICTSSAPYCCMT